MVQDFIRLRRHTLTNAPNGSWAMIVVPRRSIGTETVTQLRTLANQMNISVELSDGEHTFDSPSGRSIRVVTAPHLLFVVTRLLRQKQTSLAGLRLVLCENLELLDPSYELGISLLQHIARPYPVRFVGLSNSLNDPADLAAWLNVDPMALHSFRPADRDQSLVISTQTFTIPQSAALFKAMAKPVHSAIRGTPGESAIVFVPSRGQCRSVALDLITQSALEMESAEGFLPVGVSPDALEDQLRLQDRSLLDFVTRGVGIFHDGISKPDRVLILGLYAEGIVRVLIVPRESCWTLPVRAATVVIMGTQYVQILAGDEERHVRDYGLEELVRMQGRAVSHHGAGHFHIFCQAEGKDTIMRFMNDGLPLESNLIGSETLERWYRDCRSDGTIPGKQQAVAAMSLTFLARRLVSNPIYYDASSKSRDEFLSRMVDDLEQGINTS